MERLIGAVRKYHWGDTTYIPTMLGLPVDGTPYAELWFGAHPSDPSWLPHSEVDLREAARADPDGVVGPGRSALPFLAKVLAAGGPLSIQVHPNPQQAEAGFRSENAAGVPLDAPERTYTDPFGKPEVICAVTPFSAKCGLRPIPQTLTLLEELDLAALTPLSQALTGDQPASDRLRAAISLLFRVDAETVSAMVADTVAAAASSAPTSAFAEELRWTVQLNDTYPGDIGVIVALLLNHVRLQPGQALYLGAGNMHSYLEGVGIEVMSPSDNVVRGGLTSKHIATGELLRLLDTRPGSVDVQVPAAGVHCYAVGDDAFGLARIQLGQVAAVTLQGPGVLIMTEGDGTLQERQETIAVSRGQAVFVRADDAQVRLSGTGTAHWAHGGPATDPQQVA